MTPVSAAPARPGPPPHPPPPSPAPVIPCSCNHLGDNVSGKPGGTQAVSAIRRVLRPSRPRRPPGGGFTVDRRGAASQDSRRAGRGRKIVGDPQSHVGFPPRSGTFPPASPRMSLPGRSMHTGGFACTRMARDRCAILTSRIAEASVRHRHASLHQFAVAARESRCLRLDRQARRASCARRLHRRERQHECMDHGTPAPAGGGDRGAGGRRRRPGVPAGRPRGGNRVEHQARGCRRRAACADHHARRHRARGAADGDGGRGTAVGQLVDRRAQPLRRPGRDQRGLCGGLAARPRRAAHARAPQRPPAREHRVRRHDGGHQLDPAVGDRPRGSAHRRGVGHLRHRCHRGRHQLRPAQGVLGSGGQRLLRRLAAGRRGRAALQRHRRLGRPRARSRERLRERRLQQARRNRGARPRVLALGLHPRSPRGRLRQDLRQQLPGQRLPARGGGSRRERRRTRPTRLPAALFVPDVESGDRRAMPLRLRERHRHRAALGIVERRRRGPLALRAGSRGVRGGRVVAHREHLACVAGARFLGDDPLRGPGAGDAQHPVLSHGPGAAVRPRRRAAGSLLARARARAAHRPQHHRSGALRRRAAGHARGLGLLDGDQLVAEQGQGRLARRVGAGIDAAAHPQQRPHQPVRLQHRRGARGAADRARHGHRHAGQGHDDRVRRQGVAGRLAASGRAGGPRPRCRVPQGGVRVHRLRGDPGGRRARLRRQRPLGVPDRSQHLGGLRGGERPDHADVRGQPRRALRRLPGRGRHGEPQDRAALAARQAAAAARFRGDRLSRPQHAGALRADRVLVAPAATTTTRCAARRPGARATATRSSPPSSAAIPTSSPSARRTTGPASCGNPSPASTSAWTTGTSR